jgi:hypothetical protein
MKMTMNPGIIAAFDHAAKEVQHPPSFNDWLALAAPRTIAREVLAAMDAAFDGYIVAFSSDGVTGITCNGRIRCFLPTRLCAPGRDADMRLTLERVRAWLSDPVARLPGAVDFEKLRAEVQS